MSNTFRRFLGDVEISLTSEGMRVVPGPLPRGACAQYFGRVDELVLLLGIERSGTASSMITGSFYLGRTFTWSLLFGDLPRTAYRRIGDFLDRTERTRFLDSEYSSEGVVDAWWDVRASESLRSFEQAIHLAEPRFLAQPRLVDEVRASARMRAHESAVRSAISCAAPLEGPRIPASSPATGSAWFKCAEEVLSSIEPHSNPQQVRRLALDAWRCHLLLGW